MTDIFLPCFVYFCLTFFFFLDRLSLLRLIVETFVPLLTGYLTRFFRIKLNMYDMPQVFS